MHLWVISFLSLVKSVYICIHICIATIHNKCLTVLNRKPTFTWATEARKNVLSPAQKPLKLRIKQRIIQINQTKKGFKWTRVCPTDNGTLFHNVLHCKCYVWFFAEISCGQTRVWTVCSPEALKPCDYRCENGSWTCQCMCINREVVNKW